MKRKSNRNNNIGIVIQLIPLSKVHFTSKSALYKKSHPETTTPFKLTAQSLLNIGQKTDFFIGPRLSAVVMATWKGRLVIWTQRRRRGGGLERRRPRTRGGRGDIRTWD